tara:strand:- start:390 stop:1082 length:693 start_codon:yes stop_codon:yes gene_type:complete
MPKLTERFARVARLILLAAAFATGGAATAGSYEDVLDAATHGRTSALTELLDRGIDPDTVDAFNNSLLVIAAREGHAHTVRALLAYGADPAHRNEAGDSALMLGVLKGDREIVDMLLDAGAPLNHEGWTPLLYAAFQGHLDLVEDLLLRGADVNALAPNEANALMLACRNGHIDVVRRLLETDVDLHQATDRGYTAVSWALENRNTDIAELVRAAQAERSKSSGLSPELQ